MAVLRSSYQGALAFRQRRRSACPETALLRFVQPTGRDRSSNDEAAIRGGGPGRERLKDKEEPR